MIRSASRRSFPERGTSARSGPAHSSRKSKIALDSISDSPSGCTRVGTLPKGLNCRISSKSLPTDQLRCSKAMPRKFMLTATRRTKGESNIPMRIKRQCPPKFSMAALDQQSRRRESQRQFLLDPRSFRALDVLQVQGRSRQHFNASLQDAACCADTGLMLIKALRRTVLAHSHIHAIRLCSVLIVEKHQVDVRSPLGGRTELERDLIDAR